MVLVQQRCLFCFFVRRAGLGEGRGRGRIWLVQNREEAERLRVADPERLFWVTQTTLSVDDTAEIVAVLRRRFPAIRGPKSDDICYATQNRQDAVKQLALESDLVLVAGSANSSNSNRLCEIARLCGARAELLDDPSALSEEWLRGVSTVGVTAGASTPESLVDDLLAALRTLGGEVAGEIGDIVETQSFASARRFARAAGGMIGWGLVAVDGGR